MDVRRGVAASLVGLALLAGATGCSKIGEKVAEEAIEGNSNCEGVDVDIEEGGFSGTCDGQDIDANASGDADLPTDWPAELAPPEELQIISATGTDTPVRNLAVTGSLDGEVAAIYDGIKAQLTEAGYTIDADALSEGPTGPSGTLTATGPEWTASVVVTEDVSGVLEGNVSLTYTLTAI